MRTGPSQLPDYHELSEILAREAKRPVPKEKEDAHYGDSGSIIALLKAYALPTGFFEDGFQFVDLRDNGLLLGVSVTLERLADAMLGTQDDESKRPLFDNLHDYLSESDPVEPVDIIFVFGSKETFRVEKAVDLYKQDLARHIVISGKGPAYEAAEISEAERLAQFALEQGVPESALILEKESLTIPDNVKRSLNLLEETGLPCKSFILVNSPFSQRRGWAHFNKFSRVGTGLIRCNSNVGGRFKKDSWFRHKEVIKIFTKEFFSLRISEIINTS